MLVVPTQDVLLYPGSGKALKHEPLGFTAVVGDRLQLIGRDRQADDGSVGGAILQAMLDLVVVGSIGLALDEVDLKTICHNSSD